MLSANWIFLAPFVYNCVSSMNFFLDWHSSGKVNDLAFPHRNRQLCIITCGEDKTVKVYFTWHILCIITTLDCFCENSFLCRCGVWNAVTGNKLYTFEGHKAPVYSVCPDNKENMQVFSCFICTFASWQFFFNISWDIKGLFLMPQPEL